MARKKRADRQVIQDTLSCGAGNDKSKITREAQCKVVGQSCTYLVRRTDYIGSSNPTILDNNEQPGRIGKSKKANVLRTLVSRKCGISSESVHVDRITATNTDRSASNY